MFHNTTYIHKISQMQVYTAIVPHTKTKNIYKKSSCKTLKMIKNHNKQNEDLAVT